MNGFGKFCIDVFDNETCLLYFTLFLPFYFFLFISFYFINGMTIFKFLITLLKVMTFNSVIRNLNI